jgi:hypothetical protein
MMNFTPVARAFMKRRVTAARSWRGSNIELVQRQQLDKIVKVSAKTKYGAHAAISADMSYEDFRRGVDVAPYPTLRPWIMRMVNGEKDVLWRGRVTRFAQSSGTGDGKSKYIPVTDDSLRLNHYVGAGDAVAHYLSLYPDSRMFSGKGFILGGSFANELTDIPRGVRVGDLSANLIEAISPVVNLFRVPSKRVALLADWREKVPALVNASITENITNISGVPSWFMTVIKEVIKAADADTIHDVWPNLEVFFHGGISMEPYREQYRRLTDPSRMRYVETYNASEGFFAVQDLREPGSMLLILDAGVFYEFIPLDQIDEPRPDAVPAWQIEEGATYALLLTSVNGLFRYPIGDTVKIVSRDPLRIAITGRTRHYINAFGEEVMVYNADAALARACAATDAEALNYTVAPVFADDRRRGRHQWLIEWAKRPADIDAFADTLDRALQDENSDYQAKRSGSIFLDRLSITDARPGLFDDWLASTGKLGGQRKVPRLSNDRRLITALLALN